jgi:hypothetical protein
VFICGERVNARTVFKWAIGVLAIVVLIGVGAVVWLIVADVMSVEKGEQHRRQFQEELASGRWDFREQPALFAVAQGIVKNDSEAIRVAAKSVPDLQAPGRDGTTLLNFAVRQSWPRPESVEAVRTLLSLGGVRTTRMASRTLSPSPTRGIRRRPSSVQCWRQAEMQILAMSLVGQ